MIVRYCDKCGKALDITEIDFSLLSIKTNYDTHTDEKDNITKFVVSENNVHRVRHYAICSECAITLLNSIKHKNKQ